MKNNIIKWEVIEYQTIGGKRPVAEFIKRQQPQAIAKIAHLIDLLEIYGSHLSMPHTKKLEPSLYELRVRGKEEIRIIYGFKGRVIYLFSCFKKQKQKTPKKEIKLTRNRSLSLT